MKQRDMSKEDIMDRNIDTFLRYVHGGPDTYPKDWVFWLLGELLAANKRGVIINGDYIRSGCSVSGEKEPRP